MQPPTGTSTDHLARVALQEYENRLHQLTLARVDYEAARKKLIPEDLQKTLEDFDAECLPRLQELESLLADQRDKVRSMATAEPVRSNDFILRLQATRSLNWDEFETLLLHLEASRSKLKLAIADALRGMVKQTVYGKIDPVRK